jgi:hypothetical protein
VTTGDHYHNRPMVNWCAYWQVMAARPTETRPWWAVMAARIREWLTINRKEQNETNLL